MKKMDDDFCLLYSLRVALNQSENHAVNKEKTAGRCQNETGYGNRENCSIFWSLNSVFSQKSGGTISPPESNQRPLNIRVKLQKKKVFNISEVK